MGTAVHEINIATISTGVVQGTGVLEGYRNSNGVQD
jgi:hypothetical protein